MTGLSALLTLSEYLTIEAITLHPDRCLNARHKAAGCTLCADVCPAEQAIVVTNGRPALDNEACVHCGLCLHQCPTDAFTRPDPLPGKLIKTAGALPPGPVDLLCPVHPTPDRGPAAQAIQTKRCLAALSPATLLELTSQEREIWLDDLFCADCPLSKVHTTLVQTVNEANAWANLLQNAGPLSLRTRQANSAPAESRPVIAADRPPVSRRGFWKAIRQLRPENPDEVIADEEAKSPQSNRPVPVMERLPHFVPRQRARILSILDKAISPTEDTSNQTTNNTHPPEVDSSVLPVAEVKIDNNKCSACNLCARFCPTEALTFLSDDKRFALAFQPRLCLGGERCNICTISCPETVVSLKPAAVSPNLLDKKPRYLAAGKLAPCPKCGQPIAVGPERPKTCFACRPNTMAGLFKSV